MAQMDYFRRPALAGRTLTRQTNGTVRGDLRRSDIDGFSSAPYFPGIVGGETLEISIDGAAPVTATITAADMTTVLADINTALAGGAIAFDADGTIGIRTVVAGTPGSIEVTGGTGAALLGFYLTKNKYKSIGGEIQSTPEARRSNPFGTGFLSRGENFTAESVQRALARISSNSDVLFSEAARDDVVVRQVAFTNIDNSRLELTIDTDRVFTGLGFWTNTTSKEDLAPYFYLIDTITKQPAKSRVVAVVRGAPGGAPPFANATAWSGAGSDGNILGVSLDKISGATIDSIFDGRVVECPAANFSDVQVGDFASIAGATNVSPFSNNGQKWVVEEVLSNTTLALRPMSKSELELVGVTPTDVQPVVELNDQKSGLEVFGTLTVKTGTWCSGIGANLSVVVSPPLPAGANYQLFVASPISNRVKKVHDVQASAGAPFREFVTDLDPVANWTLSGAVASLGGGNCNITSAMIVWHGRVYNLPAQSFAPAAFADGANYVYWDEATGNYAIAANTNGFYQVLDPASGTKGHAIAFVTKAAGAITSVSPMTRLRGEKAIPVTVGTGGQFPDLISATLWARALDTSYAEGSTSTGAYPHFEFILLNDTTTNNLNPVLPNPGCIVRGINPNVQLNLGTGFFNVFGKVAEFRDFKLVATGAKAIGIGVACDRISIDNVQHIASDGNSLTEIIGTSGNSFKDLWMRDSSFRIKQGVSSAFTPSLGVANGIVKNCKFTYDSTGAVVPHFFQKNDATPDWDGNFLVVEDCEFLGSFGAATADVAATMVANNVASSTMFFRNVKFSMGGYTSANNNVFIALANNASLYMDSFVMTSGSMQRIISGLSANAKVYNSSFRVCCDTGVQALSGHTFSNCFVQHTGTTGAGSGFGIVPVSSGVVVNCQLNGPFDTAIRATASGVSVEGNHITLTKPGTSVPSKCIELTAGAVNSTIRGNICIWDSTLGTLASITGIRNSADHCEITENEIHFPAPTVATVSYVGLAAIGSVGTVGYNIIKTNGVGVAAASQDVVGIDLSGSVSCVGNTLQLDGTTTQSFRGIVVDAGIATISANYVSVYGITYQATSPADAGRVITGNHFYSTKAGAIAGGHVQALDGVITGNRFGSAGSNAVGIDFCTFHDNQVTEGDVVLASGFNASLSFCNNTLVAGSLDCSSGSPNFLKLLISGNYIGGDALVGFSFASTGGIPQVVFSGNQVVGDVSVTGNAAFDVVMESNEADSFTVTLGDNGPFGDPVNAGSSLIFGGNRSYTGAATLSARQVQAYGNNIATNMDIEGGPFATATSEIQFTNNRMGGDLTLNAQYIGASYNWIGDDVLIERATGLGAIAGQATFSDNYCGGDFQADTIDAGAYLFDKLVVHNNYFNATTISTWSAKAVLTEVSNNHFVPTNSVAPTIGGSVIHFTDNLIFATANSPGSNQNTIVTLTHLSALGRVWMSNNWIYGRVTQDAGLADGWFDSNYIYHFNNATSNLSIGACSLSCHVTNNVLIGDNGGVGGTDYIGINVSVAGSSNNLFFIGNKCTLPALSATYTNSFIAAVNIVAGNGGVANNRIVIEGNILEKPNGATISGFAQATYHVKADNASNLFMVGNLMFRSAGVIGATFGQGDPSFNAGPANFTFSA
jgi:hypothetical protein